MSRSDLIYNYSLNISSDVFGQGPFSLFSQTIEPNRIITPFFNNFIYNPNPNINVIASTPYGAVYKIMPAIVP